MENLIIAIIASMLIKYILLEMALKIPIITRISNTILGISRLPSMEVNISIIPGHHTDLRNKQPGQESCDGIG